MSHAQPGILAPVPPVARHLFFALRPGVKPELTLKALAKSVDGLGAVVGLGRSLVKTLGAEVPGLLDFPHHSGPGLEVPSTPTSLWIWLRGEDRGELVHRSRQLETLLVPAFLLTQALDAFMFRTGHDLSGFEDGTENPKGDDAAEAALVQGQGPGLDGSSFVAVQQWVHDFDALDAMSEEEQGLMIGRHKVSNEELEEAPTSAHVKRTAQESFTPAAFVLRRSMPWSAERRAGLVFVAFGRSFDAYAALLERMVGLEDGVVDQLFRFTRPVTGAYFWCPPVGEWGLDLRALAG